MFIVGEKPPISDPNERQEQRQQRLIQRVLEILAEGDL